MRAFRTFTLTSLAIIAFGLLLPLHLHASDTSDSTEAEADDVMGDVTLLPALNASAGRIEDFGFRVSPGYEPARSSFFNRVYTPVVDVVLPNTAASRAGLEPGDRIVSSDGAPTASGSFSLKKWRRIQESKWAAVARGDSDVTWTLLVESATTQNAAHFTSAFRRHLRVGATPSGAHRIVLPSVYPSPVRWPTAPASFWTMASTFFSGALISTDSNSPSMPRSPTSSATNGRSGADRPGIAST